MTWLSSRNKDFTIITYYYVCEVDTLSTGSMVTVSFCASVSASILAAIASTCTHTAYYVIVYFRLPVVQASSFASLVPIMALMSTDEWRCPDRTLGKCVSGL